MESIPAAFCGAFPSLKTLVIGIPTIRVSWKVLWVAEYVHLLKGGEANYEERMGFLERAVKKMRRDGCVFPECVQLELRLPFGQGGDWVRGCRYCFDEYEAPHEAVLQREFNEALERVKRVDAEFNSGM